jgi:hypothetical protein
VTVGQVFPSLGLEQEVELCKVFGIGWSENSLDFPVIFFNSKPTITQKPCLGVSLNIVNLKWYVYK